MTENNFNNNKFMHGIYIDSPVEKVFEYIATASGITKWFIGEAKYYYKNLNIRLGNQHMEKGDSYLWKWLNKNFEVKGLITESVENKLIQFTFSPLYFVTIFLTNKKGRTKLTLTQEYQPGAAKDEFNFINCCVCWVFFLTNLKSVVENGTDLREKTADDNELVNR